MKTVEGDLLLSNFTSEASTFFLNYRTPAAIIASASLQSLLEMTRIHHKQDRRRKERNRMEEWTVTFCHANLFIAFILSLIVLVISSTAEINIYRGEFKPLAENTFEFLNKEFHFELAAVRWCFLGSVFSLLKGLGCHLLLEYNLLKEGKRTVGTIVFTFMVSVLSGLLSYMNTTGTMRPWNNLFCMTLDLVKMAWIDSLSLQKPLSILSLLSSGICLGLAVYYCLPLHGGDTGMKEQKGKHSKISKEMKGSEDNVEEEEEEERKEEIKSKEQ